MARNEDMPFKESIDFFERVMDDHDKVSDYRKESDQIYSIYRYHGNAIKVYLTNLYTIGLADYYDITSKHPGLNAIITLSRWNSYTKQAKEEAEKNGFGIFVIDEFLGALNYDQFFRYIKRDSKGRIIRYWRDSTD